jgi:hypothetical protein
MIVMKGEGMIFRSNIRYEKANVEVKPVREGVYIVENKNESSYR